MACSISFVDASDRNEKPKADARSREWTAVAREELGPTGVVLEMAHRLREISAGRRILDIATTANGTVDDDDR